MFFVVDAYLVSPIKEKHRMLTTRQLANQEQQALSRPVTEGLNAVPTTAREKVDCKKLLTPQVKIAYKIPRLCVFLLNRMKFSYFFPPRFLKNEIK